MFRRGTRAGTDWRWVRASEVEVVADMFCCRRVDCSSYCVIEPRSVEWEYNTRKETVWWIMCIPRIKLEPGAIDLLDENT
jgi:hypothetical protein